MKHRMLFLSSLLVLCGASHSGATEFTYDAIAERYNETKLDAKSVQAANMDGECMVGLKRLIFIKRTDFDPVAEWINYRTNALLEQFPPCNVLIMMQVARAELIGETKP